MIGATRLVVAFALAVTPPLVSADPLADCEILHHERVRLCSGLREDFDAGAPGWTFEGTRYGVPITRWHDAASPRLEGYVSGYWHLRGSGDRELAFSDDDAETWCGWVDESLNYATSPPFIIPYSHPRLTFESRTCGGPLSVEMTLDGGVSWTRIGGPYGVDPLDRYAGQAARIRFAVDGASYAWSVDDVVVAGEPGAPPSPPLKLVATKGWLPNEIQVAWAPPADGGGVGETRYRVYRWTAAAPKPVPVGDTDELVHFDANLDPLTRYYYHATAYSAGAAYHREGPPSNEASAVPNAVTNSVSPFSESCGSADQDVYVCESGDPHAGLAAVVVCGRPRAPIVVTAGPACPYIGEWMG